MLDQYNSLSKHLGSEKIEYHQGFTTDLDKNKNFDIILMHNSINHVGEDLIERVIEDEVARDEYKLRLNDIFAKIKSGGIVIISDCSNRNFWGDIKLFNPFAPSIDWNLHRTPDDWRQILEELGLEHLSTNWTARREFGWVGNFLFANRVCSYFLNSHFRSVYTLRQ